MLKAESDYDEACAACEHHRVLTREQWASVKAALYYDRRDAGSRGRALMYDLPDLELQRGDRLEPPQGLVGVGDFELAAEFPLPVVFWRRSAETGTRHRNPLLDPTLGISFLLFMVGTVHTLALGVYRNFVHHAFWACRGAPIYDVVGIYGAGERNQIATQRVRHERWEYYSRAPTVSQLPDLRVSMFGDRNSSTLHAKGAQVEGVMPFVIEVLQKHASRIENGDALLAAGQSLLRMKSVLCQHGPVLSLQGQQDRGRPRTHTHTHTRTARHPRTLS